MDIQALLWEAAQYLTRGSRNGVFSPGTLRGYALLHCPTLSRAAVDEVLEEGEGIFWRAVGNFKMLTPLGAANLWVRYGKPSVRNKAPERQNATARYFAHNWKKFLPIAEGYMSRKLPRSAELGKIGDHIMGWVTLAIDRDYLAKYLASGSVAPSLICQFIYNKACSDLRKDGRDPSCRALHGALAPHEVQARNNDTVSWTERIEPLPTTFGEDPLANIADASTSPPTGIDSLNIEQVSAFIAELLDRKFQNLNLMEVYEMQYDQGLGVDDAARRMGANRGVVQAARKEIRRLMLEQRDTVRAMVA